jgi:hypothetical protein
MRLVAVQAPLQLPDSLVELAALQPLPSVARAALRDGQLQAPAALRPASRLAVRAEVAMLS